jgi:hypothetical protein
MRAGRFRLYPLEGIVDTKGWILFVMLAATGESVEVGPQPDCVTTARAWMKEAKAWEVRSGVNPASMWVCVPPWVAHERVQLVAR